MYGVPFAPATAALPKDRPLLVVVGAEKVPREVYDLVDANLAVGNQPHSEVAALAVFLYEFLGARALDRVDWPGAEQVIVPTERGKTVRDRRRA
jgi:tRNA (cytidine56-2'-O)-methyltransferase